MKTQDDVMVPILIVISILIVIVAIIRDSKLMEKLRKLENEEKIELLKLYEKIENGELHLLHPSLNTYTRIDFKIENFIRWYCTKHKLENIENVENFAVQLTRKNGTIKQI